jgi:hypothetical protein
MLTSVIDAMENRDVVTVDIPGAFMQADMDEEVYVKIGGTMVDFLSHLNIRNMSCRKMEEKCYLQDSIRSFMGLYVQRYYFGRN